MTKSSAQQIISTVSIVWVLFSFVILLFYWDSLSYTKIILLSLFMSLFMYVMFKNSYKKDNGGQKHYAKISPSIYERPKNNMASKLTRFFDQLGGNSQRSFNQPSVIPRWKTGLTYSSEIQTVIGGPDKSSMQGYSSTRYQENGRNQIQSRSNQINIFIPQNVSATLDEIKKKIKPSKYLRMFEQQFPTMNGQKKVSYAQSKKFFDQTSSLESLCFNKERQLLLVEDYDVCIQKGVDCAQTISEFIQSKLEDIMKQSNYNFKTVSETMMKCFGLKVNFNIEQKGNRYEQKEISIDELKDFLIRFRKESLLPQKFKPIIAIKEFIKNHLEKLVISTDYVCQFLQFIDNQEVMAFKIYLDILKSTFDNEEIEMSIHKSGYQSEMRNTRHVFYVHEGGRNTFFTYNRIKNFRSQNPLVVMMAFFADNYKSGFNAGRSIVRDLIKYFKDQPRHA